MRRRVYLETTVVSYLTARPSRDVVVAAHQQVTLEWWSVRRRSFDLVVSELVLREAEAGDADAAARRLAIPPVHLHSRGAAWRPFVTQDPIVREVRTERERHAAAFDFDVRGIFADLKRSEKRRRSPLLAPPVPESTAAEPSPREARFARR